MPFSTYYTNIFPLKMVQQFLGAFYQPYSLEQVDFMVRSQEEQKQKEFVRRYEPWSKVSQLILQQSEKIVSLGVGPVMTDLEIGGKRHLMKSGKETYLGKPLVLDIDIPPRACCDPTGEHKRTCEKCWVTHIVPYYHYFRDFLSRHLPLKSRICGFFSGQRGLHFWVFHPSFLAFNKKEYVDLLTLLNYMRVLETQKRTHEDVAPDVHFDEDVTKQLNHCIRVPFSVHGDSGRAALPLVDKHLLDPVTIDQYLTTYFDADWAGEDRKKELQELGAWIATLAKRVEY